MPGWQSSTCLAAAASRVTLAPAAMQAACSRYHSLCKPSSSVALYSCALRVPAETWLAGEWDPHVVQSATLLPLCMSRMQSVCQSMQRFMPTRYAYQVYMHAYQHAYQVQACLTARLPGTGMPTRHAYQINNLPNVGTASTNATVTGRHAARWSLGARTATRQRLWSTGCGVAARLSAHAQS